MRLLHLEDLAPHYVRTLQLWREQFWANIENIRLQGYDKRFERMWHYYLCYCEAGFREHQLGVSQLLLSKPGCRREPILARV